MIVVDTSVIAYLWIPGDHTAAAERLLVRDPEWCAPLLWRSELRNVLAGTLRRGQLGLPTALQILAEAEARMLGHELAVPSPEVMRLVSTSRCSAYDCEFVAAAIELGVPLVTADKQVLAAFPKVARPLASYAATH